jgi:hypothetical protein
MSVAGRWQVTMPTPIGTMKFLWELEEANGTWRGKMSGEPPVGNSDLRNIQVNGETVSFMTTVKSPMGALDLTFNGNASGDALQGVCKTSYGDNKFSAVRA